MPQVEGKDDQDLSIQLHYWSIGEFYRAIHLGFTELYQMIGAKELFSGRKENQIPRDYYWGDGELIEVTDIGTAILALELIAGQGEGSHDRIVDDNNKLAHYYQFDQIRRGRYYLLPNGNSNGDNRDDPQGPMFQVNWAGSFPIKANAKIADYKGDPELEENARRFNDQYKSFLVLLNGAFNGQPSLLDPKTGRFGMQMLGIRNTMERLVHYPIRGETGENASPTFEIEF